MSNIETKYHPEDWLEEKDNYEDQYTYDKDDDDKDED